MTLASRMSRQNNDCPLIRFNLTFGSKPPDIEPDQFRLAFLWNETQSRREFSRGKIAGDWA